jgi:hypothetical protein
MKFLHILFLTISFTSVTDMQAQSDYEIRIAQNSYVKKYAALADYIGNDNVTIHLNEITYTSQINNKLIINFSYTADKVVHDNGRAYYNVKRKGYVVIDDFSRVYVDGDRIILAMNSNGYANKVKVPGENWTEMLKNRSDFSITVRNDKKRDEVLHIISMLRKYPVYRVKN